jgi:hypothetical protein
MAYEKPLKTGLKEEKEAKMILNQELRVPPCPKSNGKRRKKRVKMS